MNTDSAARVAAIMFGIAMLMLVARITHGCCCRLPEPAVAPPAISPSLERSARAFVHEHGARR